MALRYRLSFDESKRFFRIKSWFECPTICNCVLRSAMPRMRIFLTFGLMWLTLSLYVEHSITYLQTPAWIRISKERIDHRGFRGRHLVTILLDSLTASIFTASRISFSGRKWGWNPQLISWGDGPCRIWCSHLFSCTNLSESKHHNWHHEYTSPNKHRHIRLSNFATLYTFLFCTLQKHDCTKKNQNNHTP